MAQEFRSLGKSVRGPSKELDTFPKPEGITMVRFTTDELTSFCPVTGQPDFSTMILEFEPDALCIESKSLKLYIWSFRDEPLFAETLASAIMKDIIQAIHPYWIRVEIHQNIRGGMKLSAIAEKGNKNR
jgi:7-cyano-7-deazaguanine reductase